MEDSKKRDDLAFLYMQKQEKYIYYIIALDVACIGFSFDKALKLSINVHHLPLALAIIAWSFSALYGIKLIQEIMGIVSKNIFILDIQNGKNPNYEKSKVVYESTEKALKEIQNETEIKTTGYAKNLYYLFFIGVILIGIWVLIQMIY